MKDKRLFEFKLSSHVKTDNNIQGQIELNLTPALNINVLTIILHFKISILIQDK